MGLLSRKKAGSAVKSNPRARDENVDAVGMETSSGSAAESHPEGVLKGADRTHLLEPKYAVEMSDRRLELILAKCSREYGEAVRDNFDKLAEAPNRPEGMKYFDELLGLNSSRPEEIQKLKLSGQKVIGFFCMFVPKELIMALGAVPIRMCSGIAATIYPSEELLPNVLCPMIKSSLGLKISCMSPYFESCDAIVVPITCDGKSKLGEILQDYLPTIQMNIPRRRDNPHIIEFIDNELKTLIAELEAVTGTQLKAGALKDAIKITQAEQKVHIRLQELRKGRGAPLWGRDALMVAQAQFYDDTERWTAQVNSLCDELEVRVNNGVSVVPKDAPRILLTGSPVIFPNFKIPHLIEEHGGIIVADETCAGSRNLKEPVVVDEWIKHDMLRALTEKYILPCTCACFTPNLARMDILTELVEAYEIDGVCYHVLRGCLNYDIESRKIERLLKSHNIPMLKVETDYAQEDVEQIRTRIEAFLEMITARKRK
ncbi:MAG: 2-hydroxyacyl-CoA dehydratase [Thermoplasmata archaeon]|nr:MAG: 2-hydroxyacyl-CoA dehydratase [Thermoplasmata archaeon]